MNSFERKNIKLLNLVDMGFSSRTILRILESCVDHNVSVEDLKEELGNTPTYIKMVEGLRTLDTSFYSVYCLAKFDINMIVIEKLRHEFKTLEDLSNNLKSLSVLHLQSKTEEKIYKALESLKLNYFTDLDKKLFDEITKYEPYPNNQLKEKILNKYPSLKVEEYDSAIDNLIKANRVTQSVEGFKIRKDLLSEYLFKSQDDGIDIVIWRLEGQTLQHIADKKNVTRERIRQIINNRISKFPIFYNEERYYRIMNLYDLSDSEFKLIGLDDRYLIEYVRVKYKLDPHKNSLDYIVDFNISGTEQAQKILDNNKLVLIDGDLVQEDFIQLMKKFVNKNGIHVLSLDEIKKDFNQFLSDHYVKNEELFIKTLDDIVVKNRKLDNNTYFLSMGNQKFFVYKPDSLSSDFIEALDNFLNEFYGYGSMSLFYDNNVTLCNKNHIFNERELFAITKALLGNKYKNKIEFVRNPTLVTKGINKDSFIENMILDMDFPCKLDSYLDYVNKVTGLRKDTIYGQFSKMINQYKNSQGLITLDNEVTNEQYDYLKNIIGNAECIGYSYIFDKIELRYGADAQIILNNNNLRKIGFAKTNTSIYSNRYSNRLEAVLDAIDNLNEFMISESELKRISNLEYFYYRIYDFIDSNALIKVGKNNYLNLRKRNQCIMMDNLKKEILSIIDLDEVYVLRDFLELPSFKSILEKNDEYKDLFLSFDSEELIKSVVLSLREINYIETATTFIFSRKELSINILIDDILNEYGALSLYELEETLFDNYCIQKSLNNSELSDMGYYCPKSSERVYLTKEYYEKELEEYLNGNS